MIGSVFRSSLHDEALEYAGFVLAHCAAIADANRDGELICPFVLLTGRDGKKVVALESETQEEAVAKGWASLAEAKSDRVWWAFSREGIFRTPDGEGTDVLIVTFWLPPMTNHYSVLQRFGRGTEAEIYLVDNPELLEHKADTAEPVTRWNYEALARGIGSHPEGQKWARWRTH